MRRPRVVLLVTALVVTLLTAGVLQGEREHRRAEAEVHAARYTSVRSALAGLADEAEAARTELGERIDEGEAVADAGRTVGRGELQALNEALSTAQAYYVAPVPEVPSGAAMPDSLAAARAEARERVDALRWMSGELARNIRATERSQAEYRARAGRG
ncbi:hypothetical protein [Myceligenerans indicum]|uniref:Uncharacterized protein n=1 Tax=Myceligenerans indicum TaxID=2593663 RepID=A0ABS1LKF9_9MICO|nr:hypothetical protein [Myceligenerans indicum]MBL0886706.1 hypothetical protein [Myceligenerans indicum]